LSGEGPLFAVSSLVTDMNLRLVAIPRIVAAGETGDVAFDADTIGRRHKDQPEDFDCAGSYSQRSEQTCRPKAELLGLRSRQIAEERKNLRPTAAEDAVAGRHARLKFVVEFRDCADVACLQAERLQNPDWTSTTLADLLTLLFLADAGSAVRTSLRT
jgi:hypothetical protein